MGWKQNITLLTLHSINNKWSDFASKPSIQFLPAFYTLQEKGWFPSHIKIRHLTLPLLWRKTCRCRLIFPRNTNKPLLHLPFPICCLASCYRCRVSENLCQEWIVKRAGNWKLNNLTASNTFEAPPTAASRVATFSHPPFFGTCRGSLEVKTSREFRDFQRVSWGKVVIVRDDSFEIVNLKVKYLNLIKFIFLNQKQIKPHKSQMSPQLVPISAQKSLLPTADSKMKAIFQPSNTGRNKKNISWEGNREKKNFTWQG